jgi:RNA polymerase sigma-70 factor (ECF subfamily)
LPANAKSLDVDLVALSQQGDIYAFEELIKNHKSKIYNTAYRLTGNHHDASDLAQEAIIKIYKSITGFRGDASFGTWVYHIVTNVYRDHLRKLNRLQEDYLDAPLKAKENELTRQVADNRMNPAVLYENLELSEYLQKVINELPEEYRLVIVLREQLGYSYGEIADKLEISLGTVKSRLNRARKYLQQIILAERELNQGLSSLIDTRR